MEGKYWWSKKSWSDEDEETVKEETNIYLPTKAAQLNFSGWR